MPMNNTHDPHNMTNILDKCAHMTSFNYLPSEKEELERLLKHVTDNISSDNPHRLVEEYKKTLWYLRHRQWARLLKEEIIKNAQPWINQDFIDETIEEIDTPQIDDETLKELFYKKIHHVLRTTYSSAIAAYTSITEEISNEGMPLTPQEETSLINTLKMAFTLNDHEMNHFINHIAKRKREERKQAKKAEKKRIAEDAKLKAWEDSLVTYKSLPKLLRASRKEIYIWISKNLIPVARKTKNKNGREIWEFDPQQIIELRKQVPLWRKDSAPSKTILRRPDMGRGVDSSVLARLAGMDQYAAHFSMARAINRRITLVTGPTNSGKSHIALEALADASNGIALAPLRLLAHEFRDTLAEKNVISSLYTGEERIDDPYATHICATVEMCPFSKAFDVALIDEAQMLLDPDRGAAWTAALMGVPANHIYVLGAPDCIDMVNNIAKLCGDPVDYISLERKTPLRPADAPLSLGQIRKGDAIVAFSRREVLDMRASLIERGHRVSVVYGALSPEVRKAEATCFNHGKTDVLVATDAIGMGLNLSIRRVIFAATQKYDGRDMRPLTPQEVKQIGGRAGRFGRHEEGIVGVLKGRGSPEFIKRMLYAPPQLPSDMRPYVQPDLSIVRAVSREIHSTSLYGVLSRIYRSVLREDDPHYRMADMEQAFEIASELEGVDGLDLATRWSYAMCPVDQRNHGVSKLMHWARDHGQGHTVPSPNLGFLPKAIHASRSNLEKAEKRYKVLLAWRWLALRFPEIYVEQTEAIKTVHYLNGWIEKVLRKESNIRNTQRKQKRKKRLIHEENFKKKRKGKSRQKRQRA